MAAASVLLVISVLPELSDRDRTVIELERETWRTPGAKDDAVRELLDVSPIRYSQILNRVLDDPAAESYDAQTVRRLLRLRAQRVARSARRFGYRQG